jgi:hypothetical protein
MARLGPDGLAMGSNGSARAMELRACSGQPSFTAVPEALTISMLLPTVS